jgi:hypothetical protein
MNALRPPSISPLKVALRGDDIMKVEVAVKQGNKEWRPYVGCSCFIGIILQSFESLDNDIDFK